MMLHRMNLLVDSANGRRCRVHGYWNESSEAEGCGQGNQGEGKEVQEVDKVIDRTEGLS
jgi:hypothetical protein